MEREMGCCAVLGWSGGVGFVSLGIIECFFLLAERV